MMVIGVVEGALSSSILIHFGSFFFCIVSGDVVETTRLIALFKTSCVGRGMAGEPALAMVRFVKIAAANSTVYVKRSTDRRSLFQWPFEKFLLLFCAHKFIMRRLNHSYYFYLMIRLHGPHSQ